MVEPVGDPIARNLTPKATVLNSIDFGGNTEAPYPISGPPFGSDFYASQPDGLGHKLQDSTSFNLNAGVSEQSSMTEQQGRSNRRGNNNSRSNTSRKQTGPSQHHQHVGLYPGQSEPNPPASTSNTYQGVPAHFQAQYNQRQTYGGPYTMAPQQPMSVPHTPSPPFTYPQHTYQHSGVPPQSDSMLPPGAHTNYQAMLPPHNPGYSYQSSDNLPTHYSPQPMYGASPTSTPMSPISPGQPNPQSTTSYPGSSQFHSLRYQSPMSTSPYAYSPSPIYQSQYAPYAQHYSSSDNDGANAGVWWYVPHGNPSPFQGHYPISYHQQQDGDASVAQPSSPVPSPYPRSPARPNDPSPNSTSIALTPSPSPLVDGLARVEIQSSKSTPDGKGVIRRSYHPNPPAQRSEWVMWAGNVPSDATEAEVLRFFREIPANMPPDSSTGNGVISIFLISRTNCAFVNFESEGHLSSAITKFNGQALRPADPRCARLLCRVRRKDDDLRAGVGGQRGMGMHTKWIKEQRGKAAKASTSSEHPDWLSDVSQTPSSSSGSHLSVMSSDDDAMAKHSSSSGSFASTNSSILTQYFPKRYFILKSLSQHDLDLSVEKGVWATQKHNEGILDQAFRTSQEVYLVFGVNKSGEFYGYARMRGPLRTGEPQVSWAQRSDASSSAGRQIQSDGIMEDGITPAPRGNSSSSFFFDEERHVETSPAPISTPEVKRLQEHPPIPISSAPSEMSHPHKKITIPTPARVGSEALRAITAPRDNSFHLDETAPARAVKHSSIDSPTSAVSNRTNLDSVSEEPEPEKENPPSNKPSPHQVDGVDGDKEDGELGWGQNFRIEWLSTQRLPFFRTRHLRNPWNHDREVKVSRDGTELEPSVGQALIDEWAKLAEPPQADGEANPPPIVTGSNRRGTSKFRLDGQSSRS